MGCRGDKAKGGSHLLKCPNLYSISKILIDFHFQLIIHGKRLTVRWGRSHGLGGRDDDDEGAPNRGPKTEPVPNLPGNLQSSVLFTPYRNHLRIQKTYDVVFN